MPLPSSLYDDLVHSIYDAALRPTQWPLVTRAIAEACAAPRAMLFTYAHAPAQGGFTFPHNVPQSTLERWAAKGVHEDPFVQAALAKGLTAEGTVMTDEQLISQPALHATGFYKELWAPIDIARLCSGIVFDATDAHKLPTALSMFRPLADTPFSADETEVVRRLVRHLSRALGVMFHLRDKELRLASSLGALDRLSAGVVLIDRAKRVSFVNRAADELLRTGEVVSLRQPDPSMPGRLALHRRLDSQDAALQHALDQAVAPLVSQDAAEHFSKAVVLHGEDGQPTCVVHAAPLAAGNSFANASSQPSAIVFLYDLESAASVPVELLIELFGMTAAEARAARQVVMGGTAEDMARRLGVSVSTFKTQLQAAYAKSHTHRQADLLKLLLAVASR
jgi:DNA-binding CsgD family transcriptional regulator